MSNALNANRQFCLIENTIPIDKEVEVVQRAIKDNKVIMVLAKTVMIILYTRNTINYCL